MKFQLFTISLLILNYANIDAMKEPSHYKILGIEKTALQVDVKKAFRAKALLYHPDKNKEAGAEELFKQVNEAHQILSNEQTRSNYDRSLEYKKRIPFRAKTKKRSDEIFKSYDAKTEKTLNDFKTNLEKSRHEHKKNMETLDRSLMFWNLCHTGAVIAVGFTAYLYCKK